MYKVCTPGVPPRGLYWHGKVRFRDSFDILFISCEVDRRAQPSSIHLDSQPYHSDTRWFRLI